MVNRRQEPEGKKCVGRYRWLHVAESLRPRVHVGRESKLARTKRLILALYLPQHAKKWRRHRRRGGRECERTLIRLQRGLSQSQGGVESRQHRGRDGLPLGRKGRKLHRVRARAGSVASQGVFRL